MKSNEARKPSQDTAEAALPARLTSPARRRLLRGGLASAPALLALKSTPVMACNCKLPSGFSVSGNASRNQGKSCTSPGGTPSYWRPRYDASGCYTGTASCYKYENFSKYFTCGGYTDGNLDGCLGAGDADHRAMATACYLAACSNGGAYFPSCDTVKKIWNLGIIGSGYPVPGSSAIWKQADCLAYLKYLTGQA
ncbi:MAG: hypothetical protein JO006_14885 [Paucibacter sp.]|nr:hypothetical protein [Roseateles sp.]